MLKLLHPSRFPRRNEARAKGERPEQRSPLHMWKQKILFEIRLIREASAKRRRQMWHSMAKLKESSKKALLLPWKRLYSQQEELNDEGESAQSKWLDSTED